MPLFPIVHIVCVALDRRCRRSIDIVHHTVDCALLLSMAVAGHRRLYKVSVHSRSRRQNIVQAVHRHPLSLVTTGYIEWLPKAAGQTLRWGNESIRIHCRRRRLRKAPDYVFYRVPRQRCLSMYIVGNVIPGSLVSWAVDK